MPYIYLIKQFAPCFWLHNPECREPADARNAWGCIFKVFGEFKMQKFPEVLTMMAPTGPTNNKYLTLSLIGRGADLGKRHAILLFL